MASERLSVKHSLIAIALLCAPVALWVGYAMTFTASISARSVKVGEPIIVRGHYPGWWGDRYLLITVKGYGPDVVVEQEEASNAGVGIATRGWLGYYRFELTLDSIKEPGEYEVFLDALHNRHNSSASSATTTITVHD